MFLQKNLPDVPPGSVLVTFLQEDLEPGSGLSVPFPLYHPLFGNNVALVSIKEYLSGSRPQSRDRRILYFESPMCYTFDLKALALQEFGATKKPSYRAVTGFSARFNSTREHKKRELCRQMDELFEMHALKKVEFTSHPDTICPVYQKKITIGLFDVSGPKDRHNH